MTIDMKDFRFLETGYRDGVTEYALVSLAVDKTFVYKSDISLSWATGWEPYDIVTITSPNSRMVPKHNDALVILRAFIDRPVIKCEPVLRGYSFSVGIKGEHEDILEVS